MSLDISVLRGAIETICLTGYTDIPSAASAWADAYDDYANGAVSYAQDQSNDRVLTVNKAALESGLQTAFAAGTASGAANAIASAVALYWTGGTFGIVFPPVLLDPLAVSDVSAVVSNPGTGLATALQSIFGVLSADAAAKASAISTAFDNNARTVQVLCNYLATNPAPPPPLLPRVITLTVS
jgi:hypothetical protein